jgi:hypothetical protein
LLGREDGSAAIDFVLDPPKEILYLAPARRKRSAGNLDVPGRCMSKRYSCVAL